jgi:multiple sugar transport system substrate-binding protein
MFTPIARPRRGRLMAAVVVIAVMAPLTACSHSSSNKAAGSSCVPAKGPVKLNYWSWGAGYDKVAQLWNSEHPNIQVDFSSIPGGNEGGYTKMFNAVKAKTAPDVGFIEFDTLPAFRTQDALLDISACLKKVDTSVFVPSVWQQTTMGSKTADYGIPLNSGPMVLYYRADLFKKYHIPVPKTWDDFASAAQKVRAVDKSAHISNFSPSTANWFQALAAQKGGQWFTFDGSNWQVNLGDPQTKAVAQYWQGLVKSGDVSTVNSFTPEWTAQLASGKLWTWVSAAWGAGILKTSAPKSSGQWAVAPMPRWTDGTTSANWGGGGLSVFKGSAHPYEAAQFAYWVATDPEVMKILKDAIGIYPVSTKLLDDPAFKQGDPYFGGQNIFTDLGAATQDLAPVTWGPSMATTYTAISDAFSKAVNAPGVDLPSALGTAERGVVTDLKRQGIPVS